MFQASFSLINNSTQSKIAIYQFHGKWYVLIRPINRVIHILGCLSLSDQRKAPVNKKVWMDIPHGSRNPAKHNISRFGPAGTFHWAEHERHLKHREKHKTSDYSPRQIFSCPHAFVDYGNDSDQMRVFWCYNLNTPILERSNTNFSRMVSFHKYHAIAEATW